MATSFSHLYDGKQKEEEEEEENNNNNNNKKKQQLSIKPGYTERRKLSLQLGSSNCNQHVLSKLSHQLYKLKCQHFRVVVAILDAISWSHPYYVCLIR